MLNCESHFLSVKSDHSPAITQELSQNNRCYVLITCGEPSADGRMDVVMTYGGDPVLAAYLVESASTIIDKEVC